MLNLSRVCSIDALKYMCNSFNTPPNLSHSQDVAWMVVHNLNNACKFGDIPLLQAFKDCAIVEGRLSFGVFFQLSFHQKNSSVALVGIRTSSSYSQTISYILASLSANTDGIKLFFLSHK